MKLFRRSLLLMGNLCAFGWFILQDLCWLAILPLIPLGIAYYYFGDTDVLKKIWFNGIMVLACLLICTYTVSVGLLEGRGWLMLIFALIVVAMLAVRMPCKEWARISGWWMTLFLLTFAVMFVATLPGIRWRGSLPACGDWWKILIFYLLTFLEPLALGREYRASPLALGIILVPFGLVSAMAMGARAFEQVQYAYLSVWTGVSIFSLHHLEGILLCFYYGAGTLRIAHFVSKCADRFQRRPIRP